MAVRKSRGGTHEPKLKASTTESARIVHCTPDEWKIKPRPSGYYWVVQLQSPGLQRRKESSVPSDAELVDSAFAHLTMLLADPYYAEAYQRLALRKREHPAVKKRSRVPTKKGELAARLQAGPRIKQKTGPGPLRTDHPGFEVFLDLYEREAAKRGGRGLPLSKAFREVSLALLRERYPHRWSDVEQQKANALIEAAYNKIRYLKTRRRK